MKESAKAQRDKQIAEANARKEEVQARIDAVKVRK